MSEPFPAFRLVTLIMRQISSPIAQRIANYAKTHPRFRESVCVRTCEVYRRAEWRLRAAALRVAGRKDAWAQRKPPPMPQTQASEFGSKILGEMVLFLLGSLIIIFEINRQANIKHALKQEQRNKWLELLALLKQIEEDLDDQQRRINAMREHLRAAAAEIGQAAGRPEAGGPEAERENTEGQDGSRGKGSGEEGVLGLSVCPDDEAPPKAPPQEPPPHRCNAPTCRCKY